MIARKLTIEWFEQTGESDRYGFYGSRVRMTYRDDDKVYGAQSESFESEVNEATFSECDVRFKHILPEEALQFIKRFLNGGARLP